MAFEEDMTRLVGFLSRLNDPFEIILDTYSNYSTTESLTEESVADTIDPAQS